jgi:alpha-beta hydrolase superfamily lysophospholipase
VREEEVGPDFQGNALQQLPAIAAARIPIISVCGDADRTVAYDKNMRPVEEAYRALRGIVEVVVKPGCDHHPHSLADPAPVVDFIKQSSQ